MDIAPLECGYYVLCCSFILQQEEKFCLSVMPIFLLGHIITHIDCRHFTSIIEDTADNRFSICAIRVHHHGALRGYCNGLMLLGKGLCSSFVENQIGHIGAVWVYSSVQKI